MVARSSVEVVAVVVPKTLPCVWSRSASAARTSAATLARTWLASSWAWRLALAIRVSAVIAAAAAASAWTTGAASLASSRSRSPCRPVMRGHGC